MTVSVLDGISTWIQKRNLYLYRQAVATFASCLLSITGGFAFGHTAVLLPKLEADRDFPYDKEYDSWLASISPFAMMFGCLCSGPISDAIGRRRGQLLLIIPFTLGWVVTGIANNNATLLAGRAITGLCTGAIRPVGMVYIGEVSDPKYRSTTLFCPSMAIFIGSLICHLLGHYFPWRTVCYIFAIPNLLCFIIQMMLKESPIWLIAKGHTEKGIEAYEWFRGDGELAQKELQTTLDSQDKDVKSSWKQFANLVFTKAFLKSIIAMFFVSVAAQLCGINTVTFYAQEMFHSTFGGKIDAFMLMIVTDVLRVIVTGSVCFFAKRMPTKLSYLISGFGTSVVLVGLVISLLVKPTGFVYIALTCLIAYIAIAGVMTSLSWSFVAEIFPSKVRGFGSGLTSLMSFTLLFVSVNVTPIIMINYGEAAMYGSFALVTLIAALVLIFILPETQGKSLQDIENALYSKQDKPVPKPTNTILSPATS